MKIESIRISLMSTNQQVVILKELDGERRLPIFIGKTEGDAISFHLNGVTVPRPLTHDLAANILNKLDARLSHVLINDLRNQHFYASIVMHIGDDEQEIVLDARPSDAIALAVRLDCPIFVDEHVLDEAGVEPLEEPETTSKEDLGAFGDFISSLDLSDLDRDK
ncbi:MAG: bifunctional nuclease family protein [Anaerolineae bacterium]|nr:bifunctional nuclease family protein [Candidatus Roseilinea sp.]MDW8450008.1 bifunctional nuclease family protein [Anaerolineae bacterium]